MINNFIKKGRKILAEEGITQLFKKSLRFISINIFFTDTLIIKEIDLKNSNRKPIQSIDLDFKIASSEDLDLMDEKRHNMSPERKNYLKDRLKAGDKCILALNNGEIVGYSWAMKDAMELSQFNLIPLPKNKVFLYNAYVVDDFRGKRVNNALNRYFCDNILLKEGKTKMIATISKDNNPSLKSANRSDSKKVGEIVQIRFLGLKYDYISKKALKDLQTP